MQFDYGTTLKPYAVDDTINSFDLLPSVQVAKWKKLKKWQVSFSWLGFYFSVDFKAGE